MSKDVIKCDDCWRQVIELGRRWGGSRKCGEMLDIASEAVGCTKGVTTSMIIDAITEEIASKKRSLMWKEARLKTLEDATDKLIGKCHSLERNKKWLELQQKEDASSTGENGKTARVNLLFPPDLNEFIEDAFGSLTEIERLRQGAGARCVRDTSTYLCENCCEAVQVTTALLGKELTFKCPVCHQVNHYDLS